MKIELKQTPIYPSTTLNNIPSGQVFSGTITNASGSTTTGIFYKAYGAFSLRDRNAQPVPGLAGGDVVVVQLTPEAATSPTKANIWMWCRFVTNYRPLHVKLVEE